MGWMQKNSVWRGENGWSSPGGALAAPVATFIGTFTPTDADPVFTSTTVNIGNPSYIGTRRVIIIGGVGADSGQTVSSASINGVSCDVKLCVNAAGSSAQGSGTVISAVVPSGTTGITVTWTYNLSNFGTPIMAVYTVDNSLLLSPTSPVTVYSQDSAGGHNSFTSNNITTQAGGILFVTNFWGGSTDTTISSSTAGLAADFYGGDAALIGSANGTASTASSHVTLASSFTDIANDNGICLIAWR